MFQQNTIKVPQWYAVQVSPDSYRGKDDAINTSAPLSTNAGNKKLITVPNIIRKIYIGKNFFCIQLYFF